jgi:hypothetical protein
MEQQRQADRLILQGDDGEDQARVAAVFQGNGELHITAYGPDDPEEADPQASVTDQIRLTLPAWHLLCEAYALRAPGPFQRIVAKWQALRRTPPLTLPQDQTCLDDQQVAQVLREETYG